MTEDEAKTKLCCGPPVTAWAAGDSLDFFCIASACMAWRPYSAKTWLGADGGIRKGGRPEGYCGLAGKQEIQL